MVGSWVAVSVGRVIALLFGVCMGTDFFTIRTLNPKP